MPLNAVGWTSEEDGKLVELVAPHSFLYNVHDPSRKNILARETTWQEIAGQLSKPVEECKKRWRSLRDGYTRSKRLGATQRLGAMHKSKMALHEKLQFLDNTILSDSGEELHLKDDVTDELLGHDAAGGTEEQVITDNQEYYEITVVDGPQAPQPYLKILPKNDQGTGSDEPPKKICRKNAGRKKAIPVPRNIPPIKILPKPIQLMNGPKIVQYIEDPKQQPEQRSQTIDKLIEKILKENTNEIDVFFRSMAASVKKLQPNLIPKVKMEVCNVIAKYEMQSFDKNLNL